MNKDTYLENLYNHKNWFRFALNQKEIGDGILNKCILDKESLLSMKENSNYDNFVNFWSNAHYHYGIGIENGLKGLIVKYQEDKVNYTISGNEVQLKNIGGKACMGHNLLMLAEVSCLFDTHNISRNEGIERVLPHLTDMIKWGAKYPIPMNNTKIYKFDSKIPSVLVYGFHTLDVIKPFFNLFKNEIEEE